MGKQNINVFIASSNDLLSEDREYFTKILENLNTNILPHLQFAPLRWKENLESGSFNGLNVQDIIDTKLLDSCEIVFVIVYSKIGKYTKYEFNRSLRDGKKVYIYFKKGFAPFDVVSAELYAEVFKFREEAQKENIILSEYQTKEDLEKQVQKDLIIFSREKYTLEDESVVKMYTTVRASIPNEDIAALDYFVVLPPGFYDPVKLFEWFGLDAAAITKLKQSFPTLVAKGILIEKEDQYSIHPGIKKHIETTFNSDEYDQKILKIADFFKTEIKKLPTSKDVFQSKLMINVIDAFVGSKLLRNNPSILDLSISLADYYLEIDLPRYISRAEKILVAHEVTKENTALIIALARVYYSMYSMMKNKENELYTGEGRYYLDTAKTYIDKIPDVALPVISKEMILKLSILYERNENYTEVKKSIENIWINFDPATLSDDKRYNITILEKYLELSIKTKQGPDCMVKIYENLIKEQEDASGPVSDGYLSRNLKFCRYLVSAKMILRFSEVLNKIKDQINGSANIDIVKEYVDLISFKEQQVNIA